MSDSQVWHETRAEWIIHYTGLDAACGDIMAAAWPREPREDPPRSVAPPYPPERMDPRLVEINRREKQLHLFAIQRAQSLLLSLLSAEQRSQFERERYFEVTSKGHPGRIYRIREGRAANVEVHEKGRHLLNLCAHPREMVPNFDTMASQKLMLESSEDEFLKLANRHPAYAGIQAYAA